MWRVMWYNVVWGGLNIIVIVYVYLWLFWLNCYVSEMVLYFDVVWFVGIFEVMMILLKLYGDDGWVD